MMVMIRGLGTLCVVTSFFAAGARASLTPWGIETMAAAPAPHTVPVRIRGLVTGFGEIKKDDQLDGAIIVPSLKASELLAFRPLDFFGPNEFTQVGPLKVGLPANFFFPTQTENIGIVPVTFAKETFSYYAVPGRENELGALSFRGRFSKLVELAQAKAPIADILTYIRTRALGFASNQDWSVRDGGDPVELNLSQQPNSRLSYHWNRPVGPLVTKDVILNLQRTGTGRWMLTDLVGEAQLGGHINTYDILNAETKTLFLRLYHEQNTSAPVAASGYVFQRSSGELLSADGLVPRLTGVRHQGNAVTWDAIRDRQGWLAVIDAGAATASSAIIGWVAPDAGTFTLPDSVSTNLSLLFIGTDQAVPMPVVGDDNLDPAIFTHAQEVRFARVL
jgi:hypothetical protein